jgi:uncharacterized protein YukE
MTMLGADPEQMRQLSAAFRSEAAHVAELRVRIGSTLGATAWTGPAAARFREEWEGVFASALGRLEAALHENATVVDGRLEAITSATH